MRRIGNRDEVAKCRNADEELICSLEECAGDGSFNTWKNKVTVAYTITSV